MTFTMIYPFCLKVEKFEDNCRDKKEYIIEIRNLKQGKR